MLYFSKLKIIFILFITLIFIFFASSNIFKTDNNLFEKKINLGLDLQGGSYLLLEIDNTPVIEQKLQNLTITIRNYFKEKNIRINNTKLIGQKISFSVDEKFKQQMGLDDAEYGKDPNREEQGKLLDHGNQKSEYFKLLEYTVERSAVIPFELA